MASLGSLAMAVSALALSLLVACSTSRRSQADETVTAVSPGQDYKITVEGKRLVIEQGDQEAYDVLSLAYLDTPFPEEFLSYALLMANKHGYPRAYYDVYEILTARGFYRMDMEDLDTETANFAMRYLLRAREMGYYQAIEIVDEYSMSYNESTNRQQILERFVE